MKIHKLRIYNIASLKGEHFIDFDEFQADHGSFAITGDTGAGKSSILNSIALALYGQNYKRNLTQGDFITLGQAEGKIELEFSCSEKRYMSVWDCRIRKKNGEFLKQPRLSKEFYEIKGGEKHILDISPEDVIHLNFEQFCKTIILNQGQFAKFLTSGFKDRKDILEKLYHGEKLQGLNPLLRSKINQLVGQVEKIEAEISGLGQGLLDDVSEEGLNTLDEELKTLKAKHNFLDELNSHFKDISHLNEKIKEAKFKIEELEHKKKEQTRLLNDKSKEHEEFNKKRDSFLTKQKELSPKLHQAIEGKKTLAQTNGKIDQETQIIEKLTSNHQNEKANLDKLSKKLKQKEAQLAELSSSPLFKKLEPDNFLKLKDLYHNWLKAHSELGGAKKLNDHHRQLYTETSNELKSLSTEQSEAVESLKSLQEQLKVHDPDKLHKRQSELQVTLTRLETHHRELSSISEEMESSKEALTKNAQEIKRLEDKDLENQKQIEIQKDALKARKLEGARHICIEESIENNVCVVCESTDISHLNLSEIQTEQEKIAQYESNLEKLDQVANELFQSIERVRTSQKAHQATEKKLKEKVTSIKGHFLSANYAALEPLGLEKEEDLSILDEKLRESFNQVKQNVEKAQELQSRMHTVAEKTRSLNSRISSLRQRLDKLKIDGEASSNRLRSLKQDLENYEKEIFKVAGLDDPSKIKAFIDLVEKAQEVQNDMRTTEQSKLHSIEKIKDFEQRIKENKSGLESLIKDSQALDQKIKAITGGADPQVTLNELEKESDLFEFNKRKIENDIKSLEIEKSALFSRAHTFSEQLKEQQSLLLIHWQQMTDHLNGDRPKLREELEGPLGEIQKQELPCDEEVLKITKDLTHESLGHSKETLSEFQERITEYKTILARQNAAKEKIKEHKKELQKAQELKSQWEELYQLIGKDEFRNYILAMVEKVLIQQTNIELGKLCDGRYLIQHKRASSKLAPDFYIIDKFRGEELRKVSTLSGGETFMVSLAMALALAELTRGSADLDSFFIDEGFGTLDQDSLEDALAMLQDIETRGKQIGLISHVKELTQRIPVNIHLQKNQLGNSKIEIVYN
tara:strand:- start:134913 stop:138173 length:3261 start_codon:yes stop_codon:yes gene_type:complete